MSQYSIGNITGQLYDSLLQRRKAVEYEKSLALSMQKELNLMRRHEDDLTYRYAELAKGGRSSGGGGGASPSAPQESLSVKNAREKMLYEEYRTAASQARIDGGRPSGLADHKMAAAQRPPAPPPPPRPAPIVKVTGPSTGSN